MSKLILLSFLLLAAGYAPQAASALTEQDLRNAAALVSDIPAAFQMFKQVFQRSYNASEEEHKRYLNFATNIANAISAITQNPSATFGVTPFSDMSEAEFARSVLSTSIPAYNASSSADIPPKPLRRVMDVHGLPIKEGAERHETPFSELPAAYHHRRAPLSASAAQRREGFRGLADDLPAQFDWRSLGVVTEVKYQGACGSCWAFVTTGCVESQWALAGHGLPVLSEQQLISCDTLDNACFGGHMQNAYQWILQNNNGHIALADYYPQTSFDRVRPARCNNVGAGAGAKITDFINIPRSETEMLKYLVNVGPVAITIEATNWQSYTGGIISSCSNARINHAVLVVGFDTQNDPPYWILKNSWSTQWGENGYARLKMGINACLITDSPSIAVVPDKSFNTSSLPTGDPARFHSPQTVDIDSSGETTLSGQTSTTMNAEQPVFETKATMTVAANTSSPTSTSVSEMTSVADRYQNGAALDFLLFGAAFWPFLAVAIISLIFP